MPASSRDTRPDVRQSKHLDPACHVANMTHGLTIYQQRRPGGLNQLSQQAGALLRIRVSKQPADNVAECRGLV